MLVVVGAGSACVAARLLESGHKALAVSRLLLRHSPLLFFKRNPSLNLISFSRGRCTEIVARRLGGESNVAEAVKNILEMASRASSRRETLHTDFLTPPVLQESISALEKLGGVKAIAQGGYPQAERCRISVGHPEAMLTNPDVIAALSVSGNFEFDQCSHGDFLGAILSTGIAREKIGDILLQVGNVPVSCEQIPLLALEYEPPRSKSFTTVEASMRIDALASAGFKISRSKLVNMISGGEVRLNWSLVLKNGTLLKPGDIVSINGKGRLKIGKISITKKGKYAVELIRYL
ncbi:hypothetical protein HPP92_024044 [Vanilla planifolia]|uniref:RNA-binding S4 domain-containing protein n=1 Tax=Vanilla planifolia TaxID=51239 RepID=A0A835PQ01_VANPL|nr:hypothetical protein HPP92_024044 [Vanilla planifolia]